MIESNLQIDLIRKNKIQHYLDVTGKYDLFVFDYGHANCDASFYYASYNYSSVNPFFSIHFVIKGRGFIVLNGKEYEVNTGDVFLLPPDITEKHYPNKDDPWEFHWINFGGAKSFDLCNRAGFSLENPVFGCSSNLYIDLLNEMMTFNELSNTTDLQCLSQLYRLLSIVIENRDKSDLNQSNNKNTHILDAMLYTDKNLNACDLSLKSVSGYLNLNASYFSRIFKNKMGVCFSHYLTMSRIQKAINLLENSEYYINQIATIVGYNSPLYFSKEFKKHIGVSPKLYREKKRKSI